MSWPASTLKLAIKAYKLAVSPWLGTNCRYEPSCSAYALEAVDRHGALRGAWFAVRRIARCHPWGGSGYDPVPHRHCNSQERIGALR